MLAFFRFRFRQCFRVVVILAALVLIGTYFAVLREPRLGKYVLYSEITTPATTNSPEVTSTIGNNWHQLTQYTDAPRNEGNKGNGDILRELTLRYWKLINNPSLVNTTTDADRFFTPTRLNSSRFNLLRSTPDLPASIFRNDDRIVAQLVLAMEGLPDSYIPKTKTIFLLDGFVQWNYNGTGDLRTDPDWCPAFKLNDCRLVAADDTRVMHAADAVIATNWIVDGRNPKDLRQLLKIQPAIKLIYFMLESPYVFSTKFTSSNDWMNSYWREADITTPYGKWAFFDPDITSKPQAINYAASKVNATGPDGHRRFAAIFVSNCNARNGRLPLVKLLKKYMTIDVFGKCGDMKCNREQSANCFEMLKTGYKFYLAFENANCRDYITEKYFLNALENNVVPVILGAHPNDFKTLVPKGSYIHIEDFGSIQKLAEYLNYLDENDDAYNAYFAWKGTGGAVDTKYFCRVCAMLHYSDYIQSQSRGQQQKSFWGWIWPWGHDSGGGVSAPAEWDTRNLCAADGHVFWNKSRSMLPGGGQTTRPIPSQ